MNADDALSYHRFPKPGKIELGLSKSCKTQKELSLAYTPGVAGVCSEIHEHPESVWDTTNRGNSVAIVSDGTAVLGLGNIGPEAGLPVMEGKAILFKKFADIDAYPLCLRFDESDPAERLKLFSAAVRALEPTFGGINLEDIAAPFCFELQAALDSKMRIPVFHDDQDGTAVVLMAGLLNALKLVGKSIEGIKIVISGAGAAGLSCARLLMRFGAPRAHLFLCDRNGLITQNRTDLNDYKKAFAQEGPTQTLAQAMAGADVFIGVSSAGLVSQEMVQAMHSDAIVFSMANPMPEIMPEEALAGGARIVGTGRSDYPNQLNNSLGFPGLFRAALDTRSTHINEAMKRAAAEAIASMVNEPIDGFVKQILEEAYPDEADLFSKANPLRETYLIPKQFDLRVVPRVAKMAARASMESGVAQKPIADLEVYEKAVFERVVAGWR